MLRASVPPLLAGFSLLLLATPLVVAPTAAHAQGLSWSASVRIGAPPRPVRVAIEGEDPTVLRWNGQERSLPFPARSAVAEEVVLQGGRQVALVLIEGDDDARATALLSRPGSAPELLWMGRTDLNGDPGERAAGAIDISDRTGDGVADVLVARVAEDTELCGVDEPLIHAEAVDPRSGELREVALRQLPEATEASLTVVRSDVAPLLDALHPDGASSTLGQPADFSLPPAMIGDGDAETAWLEGRSGPGRWEFVTLRWTAEGRPITGLSIVLPPTTESIPESFWVTAPNTALRVTIPDAHREAGARLRVDLPESLTTRCVSLVIDDSRRVPANIGFAEVAGFSDVDGPGGVPRLIEEVVTDAADGDRAVRLLALLGESALAPLLEAWPTLTPLGRRRATRVFAALAPTEAAVQGLVSALVDSDAAVREEAQRSLLTVEAPTAERTLLEVLEGSPGPAGDEAAALLSEIAPAAATRWLLDTFRQGQTERGPLRGALATALTRATSGWGRVATWLDEGPGAEAAAAVALSISAIANDAGYGDLLNRLVQAAVAADGFVPRYRAALAAAAAETDSGVEAWLRELASSAEEWMLRKAAVEALGARGEASDALLAALQDPYPRVRTAAVHALDNRGTEDEALRRIAREDRWPMVRAAAVGTVAHRPEDRAVARAALQDPTMAVRAAGVATLRVIEDWGAAPAVGARLSDEDEWPVVLEAAISFAAAACHPELVEPLIQVMRRGMRPNAWAPDVELAARATETLGRYPREEDIETMLRRASDDLSPPAIRAAAGRALAADARCGR